MADKLEVTVTGELQDENHKKFQKLLAYFVWHLEYMNGKFEGEQTFCNDSPKEIKKGYQTGQGYNGDGIQENIKEWEMLKDGRVYISVQYAQNAKCPYFSKSSYLHWAGFAGNVSIYVKADNKHITSLYIKDKWNRKDKKDKSDTQDNKETYQLADLGISVSVDGKEVKIDNSNAGSSIETNLENFYNAFVEAKRLETAQRLRIAKNIIFTGAPGTGKTYLAKEIADLIGAQTEFVQFHPSYDYTDFVEGLRPVKDSKNKSIVFERKDGIFKAFCERALIQWLKDQLTTGTSTTTTSPSPCTTNNDDVYTKIWTLLNGGKLEEENKEKNKKKNNASLTDEQKNAIVNLIEKIKEREKKDDDASANEKDTQNSIVDSTPRANPFTPYVFIIDEINRGEISKIFGELFFSVDPGYRGVDGAVKTQYANLQTTPNLFDLVLMALGKANEGDYGHFFIPENVYIIGTMNDIDRSVESMDFAFRRRFTFLEIKAKDTQMQILNKLKIANPQKKKKTIESLVKSMDELNKAIYDPKNKSTDNQYDLSDAYHIGAAYYKHYEDYADQDNAYDKLWDNHLKGVLFEYLRGKPNAEDILDKWRKAYDGGILQIIGIKLKDLKQILSDKKISSEEQEEIINKIENYIGEHLDKSKKDLQNDMQELVGGDLYTSIQSLWSNNKD